MTIKPSEIHWLPSTALSVAVLLGILPTTFGEEYRAQIKDGGRLSGELKTNTAGEIAFQANGKDIDWENIERIWFPARSTTLNNHRPARVFHLRGGGRVTGELIGFDQKTITLKLRGKTLELPRGSIAAIERCRGERPVIFEDFQSARLPANWTKTGTRRVNRQGAEPSLELAPGDGLLVPLNPPINSGRVSFAFSDPSDNAALEGGVEFGFQKGDKPSRLTISLASNDPNYVVSRSDGLGITRQPVRRNAGWQTLTLLFDETRFQILIGEKLLAYARTQDASLKSLKFFTRPNRPGESSPAKPAPLLIADLQISLRDPKEPDLPAVSLDAESRIMLNGGDAVFGEIQDVDSAKVAIDGLFGKIAIPWSRARRIVFGGKSELEFQPRLSTGILADVSFTRFADHPDQPGDVLTGVVESVSEDKLRFHHPWLGTLELATSEIEWIEPRFVGGILTLALESRRLGNKYRRDFRSKQQQGSAWKAAFVLKELPRGPAFIEMSVNELEPAGKDTPLGSPTLTELRSGFLGTAVFLNQKPLGRLNDSISRKSSAGDPQTIRLPIPAGLLKAGNNAWRIEQTPRENRPQEFDDCRIGPIRLLIK